MPVQAISHNALGAALANSLRGNTDRMVWEDMQLGPSGSARPDVYSMMKSYSNPRPVAYECKVSVADFRSDVTSGKWMRYLEFATAVIFVTPAGLVGKSDIPKGAGWMQFYPESGTFRTALSPTLSKASLSQDMLLKLLIDGVDRLNNRQPNPRAANNFMVADVVRRKLGSDVGDYVMNKECARQNLERMHAQEKSLQARLKQLEHDCKDVEVAAQKRGEEKVDELRRQYEHQLAHLCRVVGLDEREHTWSWKLDQAIARFREELDANHEVQRLRGVIADLRGIISAAALHPSNSVEPLGPETRA